MNEQIDNRQPQKISSNWKIPITITVSKKEEKATWKYNYNYKIQLQLIETTWSKNNINLLKAWTLINSLQLQSHLQLQLKLQLQQQRRDL